MSKLFVDEIVHQSSQGSGTITLGASGEKITTASGAEFSAVTGHNYPAFMATPNSGTGLSSNAFTTMPCSNEYIDTDNAYDNSTYTFTVPSGKGGKYSLALHCRIDSTNQGDNYLQPTIVTSASGNWNFTWEPKTSDQNISYHSMYLNIVLNLSAGDTVIPKCYRSGSTGTPTFQGESFFWGYRIGA